eukprot:1079039-Amphidinium_carterae.1
MTTLVVSLGLIQGLAHCYSTPANALRRQWQLKVGICKATTHEYHSHCPLPLDLIDPLRPLPQTSEGYTLDFITIQTANHVFFPFCCSGHNQALAAEGLGALYCRQVVDCPWH